MSNVEDRRGIITRLSILQYVVAVMFSILAISFWVLQVVQHAKFEEMAENNHQRTLALRAPRGIVLDRNGKVLVENRPSFSISIMREHSKDLNRTIRMLAAVLGRGGSGGSRDRQPAPQRTDVPADHDHAGRDDRAGVRGDGARSTRAAGRARRAGADAAISRISSPRTCSATSAR